MQTPSQSTSRISLRQTWAMGALVAATAASVVVSLNAWAGDKLPAGKGPQDMPPPPAHMMQHGGPEGDMLPFSAHHLERLLDDVNATDAQRKQIGQIADKAQSDLKVLHEQAPDVRDQGFKLLAQAKIDAEAAEQLRQKAVAHHDAVSKRLLQATLDIAQVLTPEQRAKIAEKLQKRPEPMKDHGEKHGKGGKPERQPEPR